MIPPARRSFGYLAPRFVFFLLVMLGVIWASVQLASLFEPAAEISRREAVRLVLLAVGVAVFVTYVRAREPR